MFVSLYLVKQSEPLLKINWPFENIYLLPLKGRIGGNLNANQTKFDNPMGTLQRNVCYLWLFKYHMLISHKHYIQINLLSFLSMDCESSAHARTSSLPPINLSGDCLPYVSDGGKKSRKLACGRARVVLRYV